MGRMEELDTRNEELWQKAVSRGYRVDFPAVMAAKRANPNDHMWQQFQRAMRYGRVYPKINVNGTATGRFSMGGPNLQGLSPAFRRVLLADEGQVLISCDLDHMEPSIAAGLSGDVKMRAAMMPGREPYLELASTIAGTPITDPDGPERQRAKESLMSIMFGMGVSGLSRKLAVPEKEAEQLRRELFNAWPGFHAWTRQVLAAPHIETWGGKILPRPPQPHMPVAYTVQGSGAVYIKAAACRADKLFTAAGMPDALWLVIHDEIVVCVPEARAEEGRTLLEQAMCSEVRGQPVFGTAKVLGPRFMKA